MIKCDHCWFGFHKTCSTEDCPFMPHELKPHHYSPSIMHQGDCSVCGHIQDAPIHKTHKPDERTT
jgi:rubredoxin